MPIQLSEVVNDPDFAQSLPGAVQRSSGGYWLKGTWVNSVTTVDYYGVVQPATPEELEQVPEGDRVKGAIAFHTSQALYETHAEPTPGISDLITWHGQLYKLVKVFPWSDFGYTKAIGVRMSGQ